ncbi:TetR/AcrR family transcriptional regulator [Halobacteriales archaeon QH_6_64_20]|jgi:AcrR family transcriptional regulator|nr:MAG: TetR/AcrR family transcriptional regulator [Halobacteriales archaeon QH_6_64_20]
MSDAVPDVARAEIVGAVRRALAKHGYARLTTKKVAAESEKSEAFFFYHYDTKDDLVVAFLDWATERSAERLAAIDSDDPVTRLFVACDVLVGDYEDEDDRGINVAMMELLSHAPHDEAFHDRLSAYKRSVIDELAAIVSLGIESGAFRDVDPEATAAYLLMTADGTTGAVMALGMTDVGEKVRERLFDYLTSTVLADGVSPPAAFA